MRFYGKTDKGLLRSENQDYFKCMEFSDVLVCVVCDGMGGMSHGEDASRIAAESFCSKFQELSESYIDKPPAFSLAMTGILKKSVEFANQEVLKKSEEYNCKGQMGTTLVCSVLYDDTLYSANVGDSRLYVLEEDKLTQITKDHSYVQLLLDMNMIDENDANKYDNNSITRAIGIDEQVDIDTYVVDVSEDNIFLLSTDGLFKMIDDKAICEILKKIKENNDLCYLVKFLIESAIVAGGRDNITAVIIAP